MDMLLTPWEPVVVAIGMHKYFRLAEPRAFLKRLTSSLAMNFKDAISQPKSRILNLVFQSRCGKKRAGGGAIFPVTPGRCRRLFSLPGQVASAPWPGVLAFQKQCRTGLPLASNPPLGTIPVPQDVTFASSHRERRALSYRELTLRILEAAMVEPQ